MAGTKFFDVLTSNGWKWIPRNDLPKDEPTQYGKRFGYDYVVECTIDFIQYPHQLTQDNHYGVQKVDAHWVQGEPLCYADLSLIIKSVIQAEENLLAIGIPFRPNYIFHGRNRSGKRNRNKELRRNLGLAKAEGH